MGFTYLDEFTNPVVMKLAQRYFDNGEPKYCSNSMELLYLAFILAQLLLILCTSTHIITTTPAPITLTGPSVTTS